MSAAAAQCFLLIKMMFLFCQGSFSKFQCALLQYYYKLALVCSTNHSDCETKLDRHLNREQQADRKPTFFPSLPCSLGQSCLTECTRYFQNCVYLQFQYDKSAGLQNTQIMPRRTNSRPSALMSKCE